jgi:hypothetical protein
MSSPQMTRIFGFFSAVINPPLRGLDVDHHAETPDAELFRHGWGR